MLVGSRHTGESLWAAMQDDDLPERTRLGPPGVDVDEFRPRDDAAAGVAALIERLDASGDAGGEGAFARDADVAAERPARVSTSPATATSASSASSSSPRGSTCCWRRGRSCPRRGSSSSASAASATACSRCSTRWPTGDRDAVRAIAQAGRELEGGPRAPLRHLLAFLETADDDYWAAARDLRERVVLTGRLEHDELAPLLAACEALVFPSTFPEAYGMVAAEAAACGVLPISAGHSGAKEVSAMLAAAVPAAGARLAVVPDRRRRGAGDRRARAGVAAGARTTCGPPRGPRSSPRRASASRGRASPAGVIAAAQGRLAELPPVA